MYDINKVIKHIEHLGFHALIKVDKENESILTYEDSLVLVANISKIRNYLKSNYGYDLEWTTSSISYNRKECDFIVLTVLKKDLKKQAA